MKKQYFYLDEAGSIDNNSNFFILGCYKTDTPEEIRDSINNLNQDICNSAYFAFERKKFIKQGFHACENHFDIRARFYNLISVLNIRAYILIVDKNSTFFKKLKKDKLSSTEIYNIFIRKLLKDRLLKHRRDDNFIIFEEYGSKQNKWKENIDSELKLIQNQIKVQLREELKYSLEVHGKEDQNLAVIDYINYLFIQFYENKKVEKRMVENFKIIEPKIGFIYKMDKDEFYHKNNRLDVKKY